MKRWRVLCRGSRDGFTAKEFHHRCDGHANILILILDTNGNVFGGFTPVKWESRKWNGRAEEMLKGDDSLRSFLFTLRNPHDVPPRKFALKEKEKRYAICCDSRQCGGFGHYTGLGLCNIDVWDNCDRISHTCFGTRWTNTYENDIDFEYFFTGAEYFTVKEIEVFEINE
jgi:hypothetical protein